MKKTILYFALALLSFTNMDAQVISFSMEAEAAGKNTPEGWKEVDLPKGLPAFTEAGMSETELWKDPTKGDFTVIGKIKGGDARWQ